MQVQPYLFFDGNCEEAVEFYRTALGANVQMMMRMNETPEPIPTEHLLPGYENKIMHACFQIGESTVMASDDCMGHPKMGGFSLSLSPSTREEAERIFAALSAGGTVNMPLGETFWSPCFGMVADRFGVNWMVNVKPETA